MPFLTSKNASLFFTDEGPSIAPPSNPRVITPDLRGHGASTAPKDSSFNGTNLADGMLNLLRHLSITKTILMAHSMGAKEVGAMLATRNPEVVMALVFVDVVYNEIQDRETLNNFIAIFQSENASEMAATGMVSDRFNTPSTPAWLKTWHGRGTLATPPYVVGGCYRDQRVEGEIRLLDCAGEFMKKREAPWLYVARNEEGAAVFRAYEEREGDEIRVMSGTGHWPHQEKWEEFNAVVLEWLRKCELLP